MIKENVKMENKFIFNDTTTENIQKRILDLDTRKISIENDIPASILAQNNDLISDYSRQIYNNAKNINKYPMSLKIADVIPVHKKDDKPLLKNYRPISLIPLVSKLFERNMYNQISQYINTFLSPYLFGYRRGYSTEQCIVIMTESWKKALDNKRYAGAILTDLSIQGI